MREPAFVDWQGIDFVVFDLDGTLYDQGRLRSAMMAKLLVQVASTGSLLVPRVVREFRQVREQLGDEQAEDFMTLQYTRTSQRLGLPVPRVIEITTDWMERRPLPSLLRCRYAGLPTLFKALKAAGKRMAVLSDYPARDKLEALQLQVDDIACAADAAIGRLKPHPRGLQVLLERNRVPAGRTLMIGDRADRDGVAARRCGVRALLRSAGAQPGYMTFSSFDAPLFRPLLCSAA